MRRLIPLLCLVLIAGLMGGCGVSQSDYDSLNEENEKLRKEIDDLKYGADKLLDQAKSYLDKKDYVNAKKALDLLIKTHSASKQAAEAEALLLEIEQVMPGLQAEIPVVNPDTLKKPAGEMKTEMVESKDVTYYYANNIAKSKSTNCLYLYYGKKSKERPQLRFRIQYAANERLYIQGFTIKTEKTSYRISVKPGEVESTTTGGSVVESYDAVMTPSLYVIVDAIINSQAVTVNYIGKQYYDERKITESEKQELKSLLAAYKAAGGRMNFR